jgi:hypothetical protein
MVSNDCFNYAKHCFRYFCLIVLLVLFQISYNPPHSVSVQFNMYCGKFFHVHYRICYVANKSSFNGTLFVSFMYK